MSSDPFYASQAWRSCRAAFLSLKPPCSVLGCGKPAKHVDHRLSRRRGGASFDRANLVGYCHGHHSQKTAQVDGGFGNSSGQHVPTVRGCDANGVPLDPGHLWGGAAVAAPR